jgi:hypothetical protein
MNLDLTERTNLKNKKVSDDKQELRKDIETVANYILASTQGKQICYFLNNKGFCKLGYLLFIFKNSGGVAKTKEKP